MNQKNTYNWKGKTILIAEDDNYSYRYLEVLLVRNGARVVRVENGVDAFIECIKNLSIQLVLMDIKMPKMDGFEAMRLILKYRPDIPIIAETALGSYDTNSIKKSGFTDVLVKPIERNTLYNSINEHLENATNSPSSGSVIYN